MPESPPRVPELERDIPVPSSCKNEQRLWLKGMETAGDPGVTLKVMCTNLLGLASSELQHQEALGIPDTYWEELDCLP